MSDVVVTFLPRSARQRHSDRVAELFGPPTLALDDAQTQQWRGAVEQWNASVQAMRGQPDVAHVLLDLLAELRAIRTILETVE